MNCITDTPMYAHYVFGTMDVEGTGQITFEDFVMSLSTLLKGTLHERIHWAFKWVLQLFKGYYFKGEGVLCGRWESFNFFTAIYVIAVFKNYFHKRFIRNLVTYLNSFQTNIYLITNVS